MRARVVIGANFGDEGKGLVTDYLCSQGAGVVVRFNGGAQAGHTVVSPAGDRHVFSHFGSGTMLGIPTFLSQFFVCNPILFFDELRKLHTLGFYPKIFAHPQCLVTTFADMIINQELESKRGADRHGSVGVGFRETVQRSKLTELKITMADLWNRSNRLPSVIDEICGKYAAFRTGSKIDKPAMCEAFLRGCEMFAQHVHPAGIDQCKDPVFEGAQGLLLDQDNEEFFPHVTSSSTGMKNVRTLCAQGGFDVEPYYVSRSYLTRHGAGPLPGHDSAMKYHDDTNIEHAYQGTIRFAPLDRDLRKRCDADCGGPYKLVLTHCDQLAPPMDADLYSYGACRNAIFDKKLSDAA